MRFTSEEREYLFFQVEDQRRINEIDKMSENWCPHGIYSMYDYIIMEQRNAADKFTGHFKIIKKSEAFVDGVSDPSVVPKKDSSAWIYYGREAQSHEI